MSWGVCCGRAHTLAPRQGHCSPKFQEVPGCCFVPEGSDCRKRNSVLRAARLTWAFPMGQAALALPSTRRPCPGTLTLSGGAWPGAAGGAAERVWSPEDAVHGHWLRAGPAGDRAATCHCRTRMTSTKHISSAALFFYSHSVFCPGLFSLEKSIKSLGDRAGRGQGRAGEQNEEGWAVGTASGD